MFLRSTLVAAGLAFAAIAAQPALAQTPSSDPTYGEITLSSGFPGDPQVVELFAGGPIDGGALPGSCVGEIGDAPDYRVNLQSDGSTPLFFRTVSLADTTLIINGPDGSWYCDDDSFGELDAQVRFARPASGAYDVWVGAFDGNPEAILIITEIP